MDVWINASYLGNHGRGKTERMRDGKETTGKRRKGETSTDIVKFKESSWTVASLMFQLCRSSDAAVTSGVCQHEGMMWTMPVCVLSGIYWSLASAQSIHRPGLSNQPESASKPLVWTTSLHLLCSTCFDLLVNLQMCRFYLSCTTLEKL